MQATFNETFYTCRHCAEYPERYAQLGHDREPELWQTNSITKAPLKLCPIRRLQLAPESMQLEINRMLGFYYPMFKAGHLPMAGGLHDQPARLMDYMQLIQRLESMRELESLKAAREERSND